MSCEICRGASGCPCCSSGPKMVECPDCGGVGYFYFDEDGDFEITKEEAKKRLTHDYIVEECESCKGAGEIEADEDNDDPDAYYERLLEKRANY